MAATSAGRSMRPPDLTGCRLRSASSIPGPARRSKSGFIRRAASESMCARAAAVIARPDASATECGWARSITTVTREPAHDMIGNRNATNSHDRTDRSNPACRGDVMSEMLEPAIPIALALLLAVMSLRAFRHKKPLVKWGVAGIAALLSLAATVGGLFAIAGLAGLHPRTVPSVSPDVGGTAEQIDRGRDIADGFCAGCHSSDLSSTVLTGGHDLGDHLPLLGSFVSSNLTPKGPLAHWSNGEIFRAIRNGIGADGRRLFIMSLTTADKLSDDDTKAVIAYLRSLRAAGNDTSPM